MKRIWSILFALLAPVVGFAATLPEANFSITPAKGSLHTEFVIDASLSRNTSGLKTGLKYQFKVAPNEPRTPFQANPVYRFTPKQTGTFRAQMLVLDPSGGITTTFRTYRVTQSTNRSIRIKTSNTDPNKGEAVEFEVIVLGENGLDRNAFKVRWDYNSDGIFETNFQPGLTGSFVYQVGSSSPTVEVKFPDGEILRTRGIQSSVRDRFTRNRLTNRDKTPIRTTSSSLAYPILDVSPGNKVTDENTSFTFDGSKTQLGSGGWLEWHIDGQKVIKDKKIIQHKFSSPGTHQVRLLNCFNRAEPICTESTTEVEIKPDPTDNIVDIKWANLVDHYRPPFAQDFVKATVSDRIRYTAQMIGYNFPGQRWEYRWDFNGDGWWDTVFSQSPVAEYTYPHAGEMEAVVQAKPSFGFSDIGYVEKAIPVFIQKNLAPKGTFSPRNSENFVGDRVFFEADLYDFQSPHQVEIRFDSDADGIWDSDFRRQKSWWWEYDVPGTYEVRMQLRDPQKKVFETKRLIEISPAPDPVAYVKVSDKSLPVGKSFTMDGSNSLGRNLNFEWKILDGPVNTRQQRFGQRTSFRFNTPGKYTVCLAVTDKTGKSDQINFPIWVTEAQTTPSVAKSPVATPPKTAPVQNLSPYQIVTGYSKPQKPFLTNMRPGW